MEANAKDAWVDSLLAPSRPLSDQLLAIRCLSSMEALSDQTRFRVERLALGHGPELMRRDALFALSDADRALMKRGAQPKSNSTIIAALGDSVANVRIGALAAVLGHDILLNDLEVTETVRRLATSDPDPSVRAYALGVIEFAPGGPHHDAERK
ncbi:MAG: hypothetical protein AB7Q91_04940 [Phycisphaerales bacterium]